MQELNIDSEEYLIRIGSRSKSEELQKYALSTRVHDARINRKFDKDHAGSVREGRSKLENYQQRRNLLMDELKELMQLDGIIDFHKLTIAGELVSKCPTGLRPTIFDSRQMPSQNRPVMYIPQNIVHWLGLNSSDFDRHRNFTPEQLLRKWLINITSESSSAKIVRNAKYISYKKNERKEEECENEEGNTKFVEEYDMDELMNHRIEICREIETVKKRDVRHIEYSLSIMSINNYLSKVDRQLHTLKNDLYQMRNLKTQEEKQEYDFIQSELEWQYICGNEEPFLENKKYFLRFILKAYEEGRLELPQVNEEFLNRDNLTNTSSLSERWAIYFYFVEEAKKALLSEIKQAEEDLMTAQKEMKTINFVGEGKLLKKAMIVGLTTTGAAKYNTLLKMMQSHIGKI